MKDSPGFTLLELMITIALIAILAGFSVSWIKGAVKKNKIAKDVDAVFGALQEARMLAFTQKRTCGLFWNGTSFTTLQLRCDADQDNSISDPGGYETLRTINLYYPFQDGRRTYTSFSKEGLNNLPLTFGPVTTTDLPGDSCILVSRTRIKKGNWDGQACNSDHCKAR